MATAEWYGGDRISLHTEYREKDLVSAIPGSRWSTPGYEGVWSVSLSWGSCKALRGLLRDQLTIGPGLAGWARDERQLRVDPCLALRGVIDWEGDSDLKGFQRGDVEFLWRAGSGLLANPTGTGKTASCLRTLRRLGADALPALAVVPANAVFGWRDECLRWAPELTPIVIRGGAAARRKLLEDAHKRSEAGEPVLVIMHWQIVRLHTRLSGYGDIELRKCQRHGGEDPKVTEARCEVHEKELNGIEWATVIADEAHRMADAKSKWTRAVWWVGARARHRYALSATPTGDTVDTLWPIMHFVAPADYPTKSKYIDRYAMQTWNAFGGMQVIGVNPATRDEYFSILDTRMRRVPLEAALPELPDVVRQRRLLELGTKQAKAYRQMAEGMVAELEGGQLIATSPLVQVTRLLQLASGMLDVVNTVNADGEPVQEVVFTGESNKLDALTELVQDMTNESIVVFGVNRDMVLGAKQRLEALRVPCGLIIGGQSDQERYANIQDFQSGQTRVICCTVDAGGEAVTLTRARVGVWMQRSWSLIKDTQSEGRIRRIGSEVHDSILMIDLVSEGTAEERVHQVLEGKGLNLEDILRDRDTLEYILHGK